MSEAKWIHPQISKSMKKKARESELSAEGAVGERDEALTFPSSTQCRAQALFLMLTLVRGKGSSRAMYSCGPSAYGTTSWAGRDKVAMEGKEEKDVGE